MQAATKAAATALKAARKSKSVALEALALLRLAEAQQRGQSDLDAAARNATRAASLYASLGQPVGEGRARYVAAATCIFQGKTAEGEAAVREALALARSGADLFGIGAALNLVTFHDPDIANRLRLLNQSLAAMEEAGYLQGQGTANSNIGIAYSRLGLSRRARRHHARSRDILGRLGATTPLWYNAIHRAEVERETGHFEAARACVAEANALAARQRNGLLEAYMPFVEGLLELRVGEIGRAKALLKRSLALFGARKDEISQFVVLAHLGEAHLAAGHSKRRYRPLAGPRRCIGPTVSSRRPISPRPPTSGGRTAGPSRPTARRRNRARRSRPRTASSSTASPT